MSPQSHKILSIAWLSWGTIIMWVIIFYPNPDLVSNIIRIGCIIVSYIMGIVNAYQWNEQHSFTGVNQ